MLWYLSYDSFAAPYEKIRRNRRDANPPRPIANTPPTAAVESVFCVAGGVGVEVSVFGAAAAFSDIYLHTGKER
jgi:hypothetical protein